MSTRVPPSPPSPWVIPPPRKNIVVGMGDMLVTNDATASLVTHALGSCVGITVYDPAVRVAGLLHAMLPDSSISKERAAARPHMFVDTGLPAMFHAIYALGGIKHRLIVKLTGGAQLLDERKIFNIGSRNVTAALSMLARNGVEPVATHTGGHETRTIRLDLGSGALTLEMPGKNSQVL